MQVTAVELVTETPRIACDPAANAGEPVVALSFSALSAQSSLPWASVLGAGGGVVFGVVRVTTGVVFAVVTAVVFVTVVVAVALAVVFAGDVVVFAAVFTVVLTAALVAAAVLFAVVLGALVVTGADDAVVTPVGLDDEGGGELTAALLANEGNTAESEASTPVNGGAEEGLTAAAPELGVDEEDFERPAIRKMTPISTATPAAMTPTRRSQ